MNINLIIIILIIVVFIFLLLPQLFKNTNTFTTTTKSDTLDEGINTTPNYQTQEDINLGNALAQSNINYIRNKDIFTTFKYDSFEKIFYNLSSFIDLYFPQLSDIEHKNFLISYIFLNSSLLENFSEKFKEKYNKNELYYSFINEIIMENMNLINSKNIIIDSVLNHSNFNNNDEELVEYIKYRLERWIPGFVGERDYSVDEINKVITIDFGNSFRSGGVTTEIKEETFNYTIRMINFKGTDYIKNLIKRSINEKKKYNYFFKQRKRITFTNRGGDISIVGLNNIKNNINFKYDKYIKEKQEEFEKDLEEKKYSIEVVNIKQLEFAEEIKQLNINRQVELDAAMKGRQRFRQETREYQNQRLLIQRYFNSELDNLSKSKLKDSDTYSINYFKLSDKHMNTYNFNDTEIINLYIFDNIVSDIKEDFYDRYRLDLDNIQDDLVVLQYYNLHRKIIDGYYPNIVEKSEDFINSDKFKVNYLTYLKELLQQLTDMFKIKNTTNENIHKLNLIGFMIIDSIIFNVNNNECFLFWDYTTQDGFSFYKSYDTELLYSEELDISSNFSDYETYLSTPDDDFTFEFINSSGNKKHIIDEYVLNDFIFYKTLLNKYVQKDTLTLSTEDNEVLNTMEMFFTFQKYSTTEFRNLIYDLYNNKANFISVFTLLHYVTDMTANTNILDNMENTFDFLQQSPETTTSFDGECNFEKCNRLLGKCKSIIYIYRNNKKGYKKIKKCLEDDYKTRTSGLRSERRKIRMTIAFSFFGALFGIILLPFIAGFVVTTIGTISVNPLFLAAVAGGIYGSRAIHQSISAKYNKKTLGEIINESIKEENITTFLFDNLILLFFKSEDSNAETTIDNYNFSLGEFNRLQIIVREIVEINNESNFKSILYNIFMNELFNSTNIKRNAIITLLWIELLNAKSNYYKEQEYLRHSRLEISKKQELFRQVLNDINNILDVTCEVDSNGNLIRNSYGLCNISNESGTFKDSNLSLIGRLRSLNNEIDKEKDKYKSLARLAECCVNNIENKCKNYCDNFKNYGSVFHNILAYKKNNCKYTCEKYGEHFFKDLITVNGQDANTEDITINNNGSFKYNDNTFTEPILNKEWIEPTTLEDINYCDSNYKDFRGVLKLVRYRNCIDKQFYKRHTGVCINCQDKDYYDKYGILSVLKKDRIGRCTLDCNANKQPCSSDDINCNNYSKPFDTLTEEEKLTFVDYKDVNSLRNSLNNYINDDPNDRFNIYKTELSTSFGQDLQDRQEEILEELQFESTSKRYMNKIRKCTQMCNKSTYYDKFTTANKGTRCFEFCKDMPHTEHIESHTIGDSALSSIMRSLPSQCDNLCSSSTYNKRFPVIEKTNCKERCLSIVKKEKVDSVILISENLRDYVLTLEGMQKIRKCTSSCDNDIYKDIFGSSKNCFSSCNSQENNINDINYDIRTFTTEELAQMGDISENTEDVEPFIEYLTNPNNQPRTNMGKSRMCSLFCRIEKVYKNFRGVINSTKRSECRKRCFNNYDNGFFNKYVDCNNTCKKEIYYSKMPSDTIRGNKLKCNEFCYSYNTAQEFKDVIGKCESDISANLHNSYYGLNDKDNLRADCLPDYQNYLENIRPTLVKKLECDSFCSSESNHYTGNNSKVRDIFNGTDRQSDCINKCVSLGGRTDFSSLFNTAKSNCPRDNSYYASPIRPYSGIDVDTKVKNCMNTFIFKRDIYNKNSQCAVNCANKYRYFNNNAFGGGAEGSSLAKYSKCLHFCKDAVNGPSRVNNADTIYSSCCSKKGCGIALRREKCRLDKNGKTYYGHSI